MKVVKFRFAIFCAPAAHGGQLGIAMATTSSGMTESENPQIFGDD
jgi:hypothetical protein